MPLAARTAPGCDPRAGPGRPAPPQRALLVRVRRLNRRSSDLPVHGRLGRGDDDVIREAAAELLDMRAHRRVVADVPERLRPQTLEDAYAIQRDVVGGLAEASGGRPIGYKVACTNHGLAGAGCRPRGGARGGPR